MKTSSQRGLLLKLTQGFALWLIRVYPCNICVRYERYIDPDNGRCPRNILLWSKFGNLNELFIYRVFLTALTAYYVINLKFITSKLLEIFWQIWQLNFHPRMTSSLVISANISFYFKVTLYSLLNNFLESVCLDWFNYIAPQKKWTFRPICIFTHWIHLNLGSN